MKENKKSDFVKYYVLFSFNKYIFIFISFIGVDDWIISVCAASRTLFKTEFLENVFK